MKTKKLACAILAIVGLSALAAWASSIVYSQYLVNEAVPSATAYTLDLKTAGRNMRSIDTVAAQVVYSSAAATPVTFQDGQLSTGSITVASLTGLTGSQATDTITINSTSTVRNAVVTVQTNGVPVNLRRGYTWGYTATSKATTSTLATDLARVLNHVAGIHASAAANVVYATATASGTAANSWALTKTGVTSGLTIATPVFTGGSDPVTVKVNGIGFTASASTGAYQFVPVDTTSGTAAALLAKINGTPALSSILLATRTNSTINLSSLVVGASQDYSLVSNSTTTITVSGSDTGGFGDGSFDSAMTGGIDSSYVLNTGAITAVSHGLVTGLPVVYSTSGFDITGLTNGTTYYAIKLDANRFELAATSTGAAAGSYITLASSSTAGPHTFTLTPTAIAGTFGMKWQWSDDNTVWSDITSSNGVSISSITFATPYTAGSAMYDFGQVNHRYMRVQTAAGTNGAWRLQVSVTGRNSDN